jgi:hypothetical protein
MVSLHVLVVPVPVATTVLDSSKNTGLVVPSSAETAAEQVMLVRVVVLRVMVRVTVIVPPIVAAAGASISSAAA